MPLSLATRIFLGYAVVLVTFGAVCIFSVAEIHQNQVELRLVSDGYLHLAQDAAAIEAFHRNHEKDTQRLLDESNPGTLQPLIRLARLYLDQKLFDVRERSRKVMAFAPHSERQFLKDLEQRASEVQQGYLAYEELANALPQTPDPAQQVNRLKQMESSLGRSIVLMHHGLEARIMERVAQAEKRERRAGVTIIGLSVLAIVVGLLMTAFSARTLRPVRQLIESVSRVGRGDYSAQLGVRGDDDIAVLAREFDKMATSLREREAQLHAQQLALLRAEQLAAVGRVSAQVAHEVRNPLSSIGLNAEMLEEQLARASFPTESDRKEASELLRSVAREIDRLTDVTEQYLRMARLPQPTLGPEDVNRVVEEVLDFSREELQRARIQVVRQLDAPGARALADQGQLRQVFLNLVRNSREAMRDGGQLTVRTRVRDGVVEVEFQDSGRGIAPDVQPHIFEPFFSTKQGGTGLGLAVTRQILQAHGGSIECESKPDQGTRFVVRLQRA